MSTPIGGERFRLIWDNVYNMVEDALTARGWFNPGRNHAPINMIAEPIDPLTEIPRNTLTLVPEDVDSDEMELGSRLTQRTRTFYIDFFAEDDVVGGSLISDIQDILEGRMASVGRTNNWVTIYDLAHTTATPVELFSCEIDFVTTDRGDSRIAGETWRKSWFACTFDVLDIYTDEDG
jgi:hypothetical protein